MLLQSSPAWINPLVELSQRESRFFRHIAHWKRPAAQGALGDRKANHGHLESTGSVKLRYTIRAAAELDEILTHIDELTLPRWASCEGARQGRYRSVVTTPLRLGGRVKRLTARGCLPVSLIDFLSCDSVHGGHPWRSPRGAMSFDHGEIDLFDALYRAPRRRRCQAVTMRVIQEGCGSGCRTGPSLGRERRDAAAQRREPCAIRVVSSLLHGEHG